MTHALHTIWRRIAIVATISIAAFTMASAVTAPPAHALAGYGGTSCTFASAQPNFIGWASLAYRGCVTSGLPSTADCRALTAYRWTGASWQPYGLNECGGPQQVYVYPYAAGWSWVWSSQTGWLAVRSDSVLIAQSVGIAGHTGH